MSAVSIMNQRCLSRFRQCFDLAEQISVALGGQSISPAYNVEAPATGWAVLRADAERGVAVHQGNTIPSRNALSAFSSRLQSAVCVATIVRRHCNAEVVFIDSNAIDELGWWIGCTNSSNGPIWIALQGEWSLRDEQVPDRLKDMVVRVKILGLIPDQVAITPGTEIACDGLRFRLFGFALGASLVGMSEGRMTVQINEQVEDVSEVLPGVRLDLGEVEVRLSELVKLRPGSSIELGLNGPLHGYLRCGTSQLAYGELELQDDRIVLKVLEVLR